MFSLDRTAIKPDVVGKRIELIRTNDPYTDLKPGDRGNVVDITELSCEDKPFKVGFIGIAVLNLGSWKDMTIIGRFTTMTRNI
jgi:hypothetical protein